MKERESGQRESELGKRASESSAVRGNSKRERKQCKSAGVNRMKNESKSYAMTLDPSLGTAHMWMTTNSPYRLMPGISNAPLLLPVINV